MTTPYLTIPELKVRMDLPSEYVAEIEALQPGWTAAQIESCSRLDIDPPLRKRYTVPFDPCPEAVKTWIARILTVRILRRRGIDPTDQQFVSYEKDKDKTLADIQAAANSDTGLWDLPLRDDGSATTGIALGGPRSYSEQSPYVFTDQQIATGSYEDSQRSGSRV